MPWRQGCGLVGCVVGEGMRQGRGERGRGVGAWGQERRRGVGAWGQQRGADYERVPSPFASPYADDDAAAATAGKSTRKVDVPLEQRWPSSGDGKDGVYEPYRENERV